jgi:hypothetical protein
MNSLPGQLTSPNVPEKTNEVFGQTNISPSQGDATSTLMHTMAYTVRVVLDFFRLTDCWATCLLGQEFFAESSSWQLL